MREDFLFFLDKEELLIVLSESKFKNEQNVCKKFRKQYTCKAESTLFLYQDTDRLVPSWTAFETLYNYLNVLLRVVKDWSLLIFWFLVPVH
jgi:hypothetical protein